VRRDLLDQLYPLCHRFLQSRREHMALAVFEFEQSGENTYFAMNIPATPAG
jgi:hypothetical protein